MSAIGRPAVAPSDDGWHAAIDLITVAASAGDARAFADIGLPALLAPGNIPALAGNREAAYHIYTDTEGGRIIQSSPACRRLMRQLRVEFHSISAVTGEAGGKPLAHSAIYRHAIRGAALVDAALMFLDARLVIADGGVRALLEAARAGKRAVLAAPIRVDSDAVTASLSRQYRSADGATLRVGPRELAAIAVKHLHPAARARIYGGDSPGFEPSALYWPVAGEGLLARCFQLHPFFVHPRVRDTSFSTGLAQDYVPAACPDAAEVHVVSDSDELCACILGGTAGANTMPRTGDDRDVARWAFFNASAHHRELFGREIRFHSGARDASAWAAAARESAALLARLARDLADPALFAAGELPGCLPLHIVTPVWGREYCELFARVTLPTIVSAGNVPAVPNKAECRYVIYTDRDGRALIEASPAYEVLRRHVATEFRPIEDKIENKYVASSNCYREAIREAAARGAAAVFLIPDMVLADGSIRNIVHVLRSGKRQILITGTRVVKETAVPAVLARHAEGGVITVPPADLIRLCVEHLHPISRTHFYDGDSEEFHPAILCWPVGSEGFVLRCFHLHPVAMVPTSASAAFEGTIDDDMLENSPAAEGDLHVVTDSDHIQWCELSPRDRTVPTPPREGIDAILQWMVNSTNAFHRSLVWSTIRVHTGTPSGPQWAAVEARAQAVVRMVMTYHELKAKPAQAPVAAGRTLRSLLPEARALAREFVSAGQRYLANPRAWRNGFPVSLLYLGAATGAVGVFLALRVFVRLGRMARKAMETATHHCKLCQADSLQEIGSYSTLARVTSDTRPWPAGGRMAVCRNCGAIQKIPDAKWRKEIAAIYGSYRSYPLSGGLEQSVYDPASGAAKPRSIKIVESLTATLDLPAEGSVLDLGCGNGVTLDAFSRLLPQWALHGQDLDAKSLPDLQRIPGFRQLYTGAPGSIRGQHTVVSLVHAFEHFPDPRAALQEIRHLIAPDGWLFIQVPDCRSNPFDLVVADHLLHFTLETLVSMVEAAGYQVHTAVDSLVVKELSLVAKPLPAPPASGREAPGAAGAARSMLIDNLDWLRVTAADAEKISALRDFGLFGTAIAATWMFGILGERVTFFVDEDASRIGNTYMGRPVFCPDDVPAGAHVYVPLAPVVAAAIARRLDHLPVSFHLPPSQGRR